MDNLNFALAATVLNTVEPNDNQNQVKEFASKESKKITARYIKVKATNFGKLPAWHQGAGGDAFIFIDEITIK